MIDSIRKTPSTGILVIGHHKAIIQSILDFDYLCQRPASIIAIITSNRKAEKFFFGIKEVLIPCLPSIEALNAEQSERAQWMLNLQSGRRVLTTTKAFFERFPNALGGHIFAEGVPEAHACELIKRFSERYLLVGPSGVGLLVPGALKLGAIGGIDPQQITRTNLTKIGNIAVGSTSGGMTNELIHAVTAAGKRISFAAAVGGDRFPVLSLTKLFELAEADPETHAFVYFGELGGVDEYEIIDLIKTKRFTKPIIAYVAGIIDEAFTEHVQFGHAKAFVGHKDESARAKRQALREAGVVAPDTFPEFLAALKNLPATPLPSMNTSADELTSRNPSILSTRQIIDLDTVTSRPFVTNVLSALLGRPITSPITIAFTEHVFSFLIDHGGNVSGAVNTMITARAGKDMVSSLAAGLLTIGPRFGGAVNTAAAAWLNAVASGMDAASFVETENNAGRLIAGIGHKKYRLGLPDPRVLALSAFVDQLPTHPHYDFARAVETITTGKSGSLILNVDGVIAALLLDILSVCEGLSIDQLRALAEAEFFNAFFIIPRTVGFISHFLEQKQNDEGLFRLPDALLFTRPIDT